MRKTVLAIAMSIAMPTMAFAEGDDDAAKAGKPGTMEKSKSGAEGKGAATDSGSRWRALAVTGKTGKESRQRSKVKQC